MPALSKQHWDVLLVMKERVFPQRKTRQTAFVNPVLQIFTAKIVSVFHAQMINLQLVERTGKHNVLHAVMMELSLMTKKGFVGALLDMSTMRCVHNVI